MGTRALLAAEEIPLEEVERFTDGDAGNGAQVYQRYCRGCHGADGRGGAHTFMPHIQNLTRRDYIEFIPDGFSSEGGYW